MAARDRLYALGRNFIICTLRLGFTLCVYKRIVKALSGLPAQEINLEKISQLNRSKHREILDILLIQYFD